MRVAKSQTQLSYYNMRTYKISPKGILEHVRDPNLVSLTKDRYFLLLPGFSLTGKADPSQNCLKKMVGGGKNLSRLSCVPHLLTPSYLRNSAPGALVFLLLFLGQTCPRPPASL